MNELINEKTDGRMDGWMEGLETDVAHSIFCKILVVSNGGWVGRSVAGWVGPSLGGWVGR